MTFRSFIVVPIFLVFSCASLPKNNITPWQKRDVIGLTIELSSPINEEWYSFNKDRSVAVTYGEKDGKVTFPLYFWKIKSGILVIYDHDKAIFQTLTLIKREKGFFKVKNRAGEIVIFKVIKAQQGA